MTFEQLIISDSLSQKNCNFTEIVLGNTVDLFLYDSNSISSLQLEYLANQYLHPQEMTKLNQRRKTTAKKEFIASRFIIKSLLSKHYSINYQQLIVHFDEAKGCLITTYMNTPLPVSISLAHSTGILVLAISLSNIKLGIDIEQLKQRDYQNIAKNFYHKDEVWLIEKHHINAFYRLWTLKEALSKMLKQPIVKTMHNSTEQLLMKTDHRSMVYSNFDISLVCDTQLSSLSLITIDLNLDLRAKLPITYHGSIL